ncbi:MAG: hypothetical protein NTW85_16825 [Methylococcales bacterium]|nr:hypothetical protein [Methylococcales bacterium]
MNTWIEHLNSPLVLIAFMLFVVAGVIKFMLKTNIIPVNQANSAKLLNKSLNYVFILALIAMVFGFFSQPAVLDVVKKPPSNNNSKSSTNTLTNSVVGVSVTRSPKHVLDVF